MTDVANTKEILRIIQSVPSPKAEPFKLWLAQLGKERIDEVTDPEIAIDRAFQTYHRKSYSEKWINQRIKTMEVAKLHSHSKPIRQHRQWVRIWVQMLRYTKQLKVRWNQSNYYYRKCMNGKLY